MAEPLVSIILGFYNQRPDFLRATIRSVLAQTYQNFDLVVSDNHSTNGSSKVLDEFSDPRMRVIRPPQHVAMVPHFAFAAQHAKGEFISFLASDDLVSPDWLEALVPMFDDRPDVVFGFGEIANFPFEDPDQIRFLCREGMFPTGIYSAEQLLPLIFPFNRASSWMVGDLIRIDAYRQTAGNNFLEKAGIAYSGDHALSLRLLEIGSAAYVN